MTAGGPASITHLRDYLKGVNKNREQILTLFKKDYLQSITISPVGNYVGFRQLCKQTEEELIIELFYPNNQREKRSNETEIRFRHICGAGHTQKSLPFEKRHRARGSVKAASKRVENQTGLNYPKREQA